ncbi:hypothetical protein GCM10012275_37770 [Longimycelium tulufanense]|uniref:Uncharacterized protein n=1 Tax=Longimycelium tulufanense TaxID=907463 RepID=A0A8J3FVH0_9PSEU|nr:hypothetical protein [Longimycelium tulufanense]GGM63626.1 hypothetical protein GCM10012275_37770 [Longimycelium tulufanense]
MTAFDRDARPNRASRLLTALFDVRWMIAGLFALYGVILAVHGACCWSDNDEIKTGGLRMTLWSGLAMIAVAVFFAAWAWLRPSTRGQDTRAESQASPSVPEPELDLAATARPTLTRP